MTKARNIAALSTVEVGATADQTKADLNAIGVSGGGKNLIINGGMQVDQRNTLGSPNTGGFIRSVDGNWFCAEGTDGAVTYEQIADAPAASGLVYSQKVTVTTADSVLASNQRLCPTQGVEGYDWNRLKWGTSEAKPATVQFWVKSSVTGTYGFSLRTGVNGMSYTQPYTISSANTWEYKTFTVAGPTSILGGSVSATNGTAWYLIFGLGFGAGFDTGVDNTWAAVSNGQGRAAHTNLMATNGATWQLTGFQIEVGSVATDFEHRSYGEELALCQRYFERMSFTTSAVVAIGSAYAATHCIACMNFTEKRAIPSITMPTCSEAGFSFLTTGADYPSNHGTMLVPSSTISKNNFRFASINGAGHTAGDATWVHSGGANVIDINAEL